MVDLQQILNLFKLAGKLKKTERTGWVTRVNIENPESVADHSFRVAIIGMIIGELKKVDSNKLTKMLLMHDLGESVIGDFDMFAKKKIGESAWKEKEKNAINDILFKNLPEKLAQSYYDVWLEFDEQKTDLSKLANAIDKFEVLLQASEYEKEGYDRNKFEIFWRYGEPFVTDPDLKDLLQVVKKELVKRD